MKSPNEEIIIPIKVTPKANRNEIVGWENGELKVRIAAVPEKGGANKELLNFLAKQFNVAKSQVRLVSGETSRHKRVSVSGVTLTELNLPYKED